MEKLSKYKNIGKIGVLPGGRVLLVLAFILFQNLSFAQAPLYTAPGSNIHSFAGAEVSIWGDVTHNGNWSSQEGAKIKFYGDTFVNSSTATLNGAGRFTFQKPRPAPYFNSGIQKLSGGYDADNGTGCSFPDLWLNNLSGLYLKGSAKVRDTFNFISGHVFHEKKEFVIGNGNPGVILGYTQDKFFVTNGIPADAGGFLHREGVQLLSGEVAFPVGNSDYTPAKILNSGTIDRLGVRAFAETYQFGKTGVLVSPQTSGQTWELKEYTNGGSDIDLTLQHNPLTEGTTYIPLRNKHYITRYVGTAPNTGGDTVSNSHWDLLSYSNLGPGVTPGTITTGAAISGAVMTLRTNITSLSLFAKTIYSPNPLPVKLTWLDALWDSENAKVYWQTSTEINNDHFIVERSFNGKDYEPAGKVKSLAQGGNSMMTLNYVFVDPKIKNNVVDFVYYRLTQVDYNGTTELFGPAVLKKNGLNKDDMKIMPNPASSLIQVRINKPQGINSTLVLSDQLGVVIKIMDLDPKDKLAYYPVDVSNLAIGIYYMTYQSNEGNITQKVIVAR